MRCGELAELHVGRLLLLLLLLVLILCEDVGLWQRWLRLNAIRLMDDGLRQQLLPIDRIELDALRTVDGEASAGRRLTGLMLLELLYHLLLLREKLRTERLLKLRSNLRLSTERLMNQN